MAAQAEHEGRQGYEDFLARGRARWGGAFTTEAMPEKFIEHYRSARVKVRRRSPGGIVTVMFGRVSASTGPKPRFLLMRRGSNMAMAEPLIDTYHVVAVQRGGRYRTVKACLGETGTEVPGCRLEWGHGGPCA